MADESTAAAVEQTTETTPAPETEKQTAEEKVPFDFPPAPEGESEPKGTSEEKLQEEIVVPEKYEFHLPEGLMMTPEIEEKFTAIAKGMKLTQEQADGLIGLHSEIMLNAMKQAEAQKDAWVDECHKAGLSKPEKLDMAVKAVKAFDETGKVMQELIDSGLAYSPNVQRFLQLIGSYLSEDTAPDNKPAAQAKSAADLLFGNSKY